MAAQAAGAFRRTPVERFDQRIAWERQDQAFFAAGACHILAWVCRDVYEERKIMVAAMRLAGDRQVSHVYATWGGWAFDHSGWNQESELLAVNATSEERGVERLDMTTGLADFCRAHRHRLPHEFWQDPIDRARSYVARHRPPWS